MEQYGTSFVGRDLFEMGISQDPKIITKKGACLTSIHAYFHLLWLCKNRRARSRVMNNEQDVDLESLYAYSQKNKIKVSEGWSLRNIGEILLNIDDHHMADAEKWIQRQLRQIKETA